MLGDGVEFHESLGTPSLLANSAKESKPQETGMLRILTGADRKKSRGFNFFDLFSLPEIPSLKPAIVPSRGRTRFPRQVAAC
jgi:hypothetical protein